MAIKPIFIKTLKVLLWTVMALSLVLVVAYWSAPSWVPSQIQRFLPDSIELSDVQLQRPGLTSTRVDALTLSFGPQKRYQAQLKDVNLSYSLWRQQLTGITAQHATITIKPEARPKSTQKDILKSIPLPVLPVPELTLDTLEVKGLTLDTIIARDVLLTEQDNKISASTNILFQGFTINFDGQAHRSRQQLSTVNMTVSQGGNTIELTAQPLTPTHWSFNTNNLIKLRDFYPQFGIDSIDAKLIGTIDFTAAPTVVVLEPSSNVHTTLNSDELGMNSWATEQLRLANLSADLKHFQPLYEFYVTVSDQATFELTGSSIIKLTQGVLNSNVSNPSIRSDMNLSSVSLDLNKALTESMQSVVGDVSFNLKGLPITYSTPDIKIDTTLKSLSFNAPFNLNDGMLTVPKGRGQLSLGESQYNGKNSSGSFANTNWTLKGASTFALTVPSKTAHDWHLATAKPTDAYLQLSSENKAGERFQAKSLSSTLTLKQPANTKFATISGSYQANSLSLKQQPLTLKQIEGTMALTTSDNAPSGQLSFADARFENEDYHIKNISGDINWAKNKDFFLAKGFFNHKATTIPFDYSFRLEQSKHRLKIKKSTLAITNFSSWFNILNNYPELTFNSGNLEVVSLDGDPISLLFDGKLELNNFSLNYDELSIKNWTIEDTLSAQSQFGGKIQSRIDSIELATDIAITDISFLMPHTINSFTINNFKGNLLKGSIEIPQLSVSADGIPPFTAYLESIDMGALLKALNSEKLQLEGLFNFTLPLIVSSKGQQIQNGTFKSVGPGVLKLKSTDGEKANIAFQALENFQYKEFSGTINYDHTGNYIIGLHLLGSNPQLYNGFPIKLDLTLRGQLPELLYSMIVTGDMTKPILDDLEQKQMLNIQQ